MFKKILLTFLLLATAFAGPIQAQAFAQVKISSTSTQSSKEAPMKRPPSDAMAWVLGTKLGHAAIGRDAGASPQKVDELYDVSVEIAAALGTTLQRLPKRTTETKPEYSAKILHYMLVEVEPVALHLSKTYDKRHGDLFEIAMKSTSLAILYVPGDETGMTAAGAIESRAKRCELPESLWKPLVDSIRKKETFDMVVKGKLAEMQSGIRQHLVDHKE